MGLNCFVYVPLYPEHQQIRIGISKIILVNA